MTGIRLTNSTNIVIAGNNFTYNNVAIVLNESHNSTIIGNNVINNYGYDEGHRVTCNAIIIFGDNNLMTKNNICLNNRGIFIDFDVRTGKTSYGNRIIMNYIASNKNYGIYLSSNYNATVVGNIIANNKYGVMVG